MYKRVPPEPRDIIKQLIEAHGYPSARALASKAGISQPTLSRYLAGATDTMEVPNWMALARTLGVTVSELLGEVPLGGTATARELLTVAQQLDERGIETMITVGRALLGDDKSQQ